jgi:hypothetical protein
VVRGDIGVYRVAKMEIRRKLHSMKRLTEAGTSKTHQISFSEFASTLVTEVDEIVRSSRERARMVTPGRFGGMPRYWPIPKG